MQHIDDKIPLIVVIGPTASGKTDLAISIAKKFDGEVVSADSMQIYKGLHIASAAPNEDEIDGIPHHLIEFLEPDQQFSVADYVNLAKDRINDIYKRGKMPILAGGTGLYVNSLIDGITFCSQKHDPEHRRYLEEEYDRVGGAQMLAKLQEIDPEYAEKLHENDKKRIVRAFESMELSGSTVSEQNKASRGDSPYNVCMIGISFSDRKRLYERIDRRVDLMIKAGLLEEAREAFSREKAGAAQAIGHKEFFSYFKGELALDDAVSHLKQQTRRYAKRQLTWFGRDDRINWILRDTIDDPEEKALSLIEGWLNKE